jgi:hypothetical protein
MVTDLEERNGSVIGSFKRHGETQPLRVFLPLFKVMEASANSSFSPHLSHICRGFRNTIRS